MGILDTTSNVAQGIAHFAARASEVLPNITPNAPLDIDPAENGRNISQKLVDLRVPQALKDWLSPALGSLAFTIDTVQVQGRFGSPARSYDVIKNVAGQRSIFHIPKEILMDGANWEAVGGVISALRLKKQVLIVVSEGLEAPSVAYSLFGGPAWLEDSGIIWTFIPWRNLQEVMPLPADEQRVYLPNLFHLEKLLDEARKLPEVQTTSRITDAELGTLASILSVLPVFIDNAETGWRTQLGQAGLQGLTGSFYFGGAPNVVAYNVLSQLRNYAPLADKPQDQVLGRLLCQILTIADLKPDDANKIRSVLKTYNLAPSLIDL